MDMDHLVKELDAIKRTSSSQYQINTQIKDKENPTLGYIYYIGFTIFSSLGSLFAKFIYDSRHPDVSGY